MTQAALQRGIGRAARETFGLWERFGLHVTPVHFHQPIPDTRRLPASLWRSQSELVGVDLREGEQLALLERLSADWRNEYEAFPRSPSTDPLEYHVDNDFFGAVDGELAYALLRDLRPRRMIEVGSGFSTLLAAAAVQRNASDGGPICEYVAIDPYPPRTTVPGLTRLIRTPAEAVPLNLFESLEDGDVLFIDSSHALRIGGDVQYLYLEVLPRLARGVHVHVHDIFLPAEYPRTWVMREHRFWTEQYLLQAFLAFNTEWRVTWAGQFMHLRHPDALSRAFASYGPTRSPGSIWMRRSGPP